MDGKGEDETSENVVRLPREWVGPREDLVPMGPRARARAREREAARAGGGEGSALDTPTWDDETGGDIPGADDFWGEGASAVHHVVRAPSWDEAPDDHSTVQSAPITPKPRPRPRPRAHRGTTSRPSARELLGAAAGLILLVAVVGLTFGGSGRRATRNPIEGGSASAGFVDFSHLSTAAQTATGNVGAITRRVGRADARAQRRDLRLAVASGREDTRALRTALATHRSSSVTHPAPAGASIGSPTQSGTTAAQSPMTTTTGPAAPTSSTGSSGTTSGAGGSSGSGSGTTTSGSSGSGGSHPVFGSGGLLGAGHAG